MLGTFWTLYLPHNNSYILPGTVFCTSTSEYEFKGKMISIRPGALKTVCKQEFSNTFFPRTSIYSVSQTEVSQYVNSLESVGLTGQFLEFIFYTNFSYCLPWLPYFHCLNIFSRSSSILTSFHPYMTIMTTICPSSELCKHTWSISVKWCLTLYFSYEIFICSLSN
jgi:hypothetical protein